MENKKLILILEAIATIALGILVAIFGTQTLSMYFGIVFLVASVGFLVACIMSLVKLHTLTFVPVASCTVLATLGVLLLVRVDMVGFLVWLFIYLLLGVGAALVLHGIYFMIKHNVIFGIGEVTLGIIVTLLSSLYLTVYEFQVVFWIVVGVVIAVYGVLLLIGALFNKDFSSPKVIDQKVEEVKDAE